jgi:DNA topoisomerase-3
MENAGRQVADEEMARALMSAEGLGTAATRADIIQNLKTKAYVDEALRPTFKGIHLVRVLKKLGVERLTSPELTARLELQLGEVEDGKRAAQAFMAEIARYVTETVKAARDCDFAALFPDADALGPCPECGGQVFERVQSYSCRQCTYALAKDLAGRYLDRSTAALALATARTEPLEGLLVWGGKDARAVLERRGRTLVACFGDGSEKLVSTPDAFAGPGVPRAGAGRSGASGTKSTSKTYHNQNKDRVRLTACPHHKDGNCSVVETKGAFVCTKRLEELTSGVAAPRGFLLQKLLCGRPMTAEEAVLLAEKGETPELTGFVSKAGRSFAARLKLAPDGRASFAFAERPKERPRPGSFKARRATKEDLAEEDP